MNEGIYVEKTDQFKRTAALVGYALIFCGMLWDVVMPLISTSMIIAKYSCMMVWLMSSILTPFSARNALTFAIMPFLSFPVTVTTARIFRYLPS